MTPEQYAAEQEEMTRLRGVEAGVQAQLRDAVQARLRALALCVQACVGYPRIHRVKADTPKPPTPGSIPP